MFFFQKLSKMADNMGRRHKKFKFKCTHRGFNRSFKHRNQLVRHKAGTFKKWKCSGFTSPAKKANFVVDNGV